MEKYCQSKEIVPDDYNKDTHILVKELRNEQKKTYQEIANKLGINPKLIGFYERTDPSKGWKLADWIIAYHIKDSSIYEKVDYLVDNDKRLVEKFKKANRSAIYIERL